MKLWIVSLICVLCLSSSALAVDRDDNKKLLNDIVSSIKADIKTGKLPKRMNLDIQVKAGTVRVTGRVENKDESRAIVNSVLNVEGIQGIQLNLGIGKEPAQMRSKLNLLPVNLNKGDWNLSFD